MKLGWILPKLWLNIVYTFATRVSGSLNQSPSRDCEAFEPRTCCSHDVESRYNLFSTAQAAIDSNRLPQIYQLTHGVEQHVRFQPPPHNSGDLHFRFSKYTDVEIRRLNDRNSIRLYLIENFEYKVIQNLYFSWIIFGLSSQINIVKTGERGVGPGIKSIEEIGDQPGTARLIRPENYLRICYLD